METIGNRIKSKRKKLKMTQLELAQMLNVTDRAVSKWEQNQGNPDISILPKIAEIFNVSLDYLLTGKEPKQEMVIISKIELCAKNDDPSMLKSLTSNKDENNKSLLDYVKKYNSKKVLKALIDSTSNLASLFGYKQNFGKLNVIKAIEIMLLCIPVNRERIVIKNLYGKDIREADNDFVSALNQKDNYSKDVVDGFKKIFELLVKDYKKLSNAQKEYYFGMKENEGENKEVSCWFNAYPYFVDYAIKENNKELCELLLTQIEKHNKWVEIGLNNFKRQFPPRIYPQYNFKGRKVYLLKSTVDYLLDIKQFKLAYRVNLLLSSPYPKRKIELIEMENNPNMTEKEKIEFRCVDHHIIVPEEIKKLKDLQYVKFLLDNNYVIYYEMVYKLLKNDKKTLFKFFIDNNLESFCDFLINGNNKRLLTDCWWYFNGNNELGLKQPIIFNNDDKNKVNIKNYTIYVYRKKKSESEDFAMECEKEDENEIINYIELYKKELFEKIKANVEIEEKEKQNKLEKSKLIKGLTCEYFEKLLLKEEIEMFIIKLCSLFDAILIFDYKCDANDFADRMKQFFDKNTPKSQYVDDWRGDSTINNITSWEENRELLNKLRMKRNSIVHPENDENIKLSIVELKQCLDFVFKVNGGNINNG